MIKSGHNKYLFLTVLGLVMAVVCLVLFLRLSSYGLQLDLTDDGRYSLSEYSRRQAQEISSPIYVKVYVSENLNREYPVLGKYAEFVVRYLQQYEKANPQYVSVEVKNPEPFSDIEKDALANGLQSFLDQTGQMPMYFGAVFFNDAGQKFVIPKFEPDRRVLLEKDITGIFSRFNQKKHQTLGIISPIVKLISRDYGSARQHNAALEELSLRYNISEINPYSFYIPDDIDVLLIVAPYKISSMLRYGIDQYVLRGGKVIFLPDIYAEAYDFKMLKDTLENTNKILSNWGLELLPDVVGDNSLGEMREMTLSGQAQVKKYPLWLNLGEDEINTDVPLLAGLKNISMRTVGSLRKTEKMPENVLAKPLLQTGTNAGRVSAEDAKRLNEGFIASAFSGQGEQHVLGWLLEGTFQSAYKEPPAAVSEEVKQQYLFTGVRPGAVLVLADSDFLQNELWVDLSQAVGNHIYGQLPFQDNGALLIRAVDYLSGNMEFGHLYKSSGKKISSVGDLIQNQVVDKYAEEYKKLQMQLLTLNFEQHQLAQGFAAGTVLMDSEQIKRQQLYQVQLEDIQNRLKELDYKIKKESNTQTTRIIIINAVLIPLLLLLIWIITYYTNVKRFRRRVKEKFNASSPL